MLNEYSELPTELIRSLINKIKLFCKELKFQRLCFWESGQETSQTNFFGGHRDKATDKNIQKLGDQEWCHNHYKLVYPPAKHHRPPQPHHPLPPPYTQSYLVVTQMKKCLPQKQTEVFCCQAIFREHLMVLKHFMVYNW